MHKHSKIDKREAEYVDCKSSNRNAHCTLCTWSGRANCLNIHISKKHPQAGAYKCTYCSVHFTTKETIARHLRQKHSEAQIVKMANGIKLMAEEEQDLQQQRVSDSRRSVSKPFTCDRCNHRTRSAAELRYHIDAKHNDGKPYKCVECCKVFTWKNSYDKHMRNKHSSNNAHKCTQCDELFDNNNTLRRHFDERHREKLQCEQCSYSTRLPSQYRRHLSTHNDTLFKCSQCDHRSKSVDMLKAHQRSKHTEVNEQNNASSCIHCMKTFTNAWQLFYHKFKIHNIGGKHCYECDFSAYSHKELRRHINYRHTNERPHRCTECSVAFVEYSKLQRHMLQKHSSPQQWLFQCTFCEQRFPLKQTLNAHVMARHTDERPHACHICDYRCRTVALLNDHLRKHSGDRPFICSSCERAFCVKSALRHHMRNMHCKAKFTAKQTKLAKAQKRRCNECQVRIESDAAFKSHLQQCYTKETVITCDLCAYSSCSQYDVSKHKLAAHSEGERDVKEEQMTNDDMSSELGPKIGETIDCDEGDLYEQKVDRQEHKTHYCDLCDFIAFDRKLLEEHLAGEH